MWSLNVPETHADDFSAALDQAEPSPAEAPSAEVTAAKTSIKTLFDALVQEEGGAGKSYKASAHAASTPHTGIRVECSDAANSWN